MPQDCLMISYQLPTGQVMMVIWCCHTLTGLLIHGALPHVPDVHDDVIKWKHFPYYWSFVQGIHRPPVNSPHKGQWRGALMFSLICVWINGWVNNHEVGDLRCHRAHYDVIVRSRNCTYISLISEDVLWNKFVSISCEFVLSWMPQKWQNILDDRTTMVQVNGLVPSDHYLSQCWPRSMPPFGIARLGFNETEYGLEYLFRVLHTLNC